MTNHYEAMAASAETLKTNNVGSYTTLQSPATALRQALSQVPVIPSALHEGIPVIKVTSGGALKPRILTLSSDNLALFVTHQKVKTSGQVMVAQVASRLPIPLWRPRKGFALTNATSLKDRYVRYLDIADIDSIVVGVKGTMVLEQTQLDDPATIVSIYHHGMEDSLNLIMEDSAHQEGLVQTLKAIQKTYHEVIPWISSKALLLRHLWYHVDVDQNANISRNEFSHICEIINLETNAKKFFDDFPKTGTDLTYQECMKLLHHIQTSLNQQVILWDDLFSEGAITPKDFWVNFLQDIQEEATTTIEDAQRLIQCITCLDVDAEFQQDAQDLPPPDKPVSITQAQWEEYLLSKFNSAYDPVYLQTPPDSYWDEPISQYWINTSHNTYLTGDQLQSKSSVEAYTWCLYRGCKCLELDCWDGSGGQAVVFHGHTLTSKILFVDIIKVVQAYLMCHPSTLPIILSLENHCSRPVQSTMASQLQEIFGDALYVPPPLELNEQAPLPSPLALRGKVVIKGKRPPEPDEGSVTEPEEDGDTDPYDEALELQTKKKSTSKIVPELATLTLFHGTKFKAFETSIVSDSSHMHSIGETKIAKLLKSPETPTSWRRYNEQHMTRTYPAGVRVDSSNYNPILAWAMGCQLVALNFQTHDLPMLLNDGRFRQAGGGGYVRKPVGGCDQPRTIQIQVISGHCLPKPGGVKVGEAIDPYVRVELHDVQTTADGREEYIYDELQTSVVKNNGFCPSWNSGKYKSFCVHNPNVAMFYFQVLDEDLGVDDKIASAAIPVNCLREGYRSVSLWSGRRSQLPSGPFEYASLLVRIHFDDTDGA